MTPFNPAYILLGLALVGALLVYFLRTQQQAPGVVDFRKPKRARPARTAEAIEVQPLQMSTREWSPPVPAPEPPTLLDLLQAEEQRVLDARMKWEKEVQIMEKRLARSKAAPPPA